MRPERRGRLLLLGSIPVGLLALLVAVHSTAGEHGSYLPAKALFPYTMLAASSSTGLPDWAIALALLQFPAYGALLHRAARRSSAGRASVGVRSGGTSETPTRRASAVVPTWISSIQPISSSTGPVSCIA